MARKMADTQKTFNIAVVGLSGSEKEKGCMGTGKSCLCNRFVRPFADDYFPDHISVLSQSDFNGRVVNNDHWLYWGEVTKITDENVELQFSIVEQTEFLDDACFQPFKSGKSDPYYKRCAATRLCSGEKLMYICKNQLGIEKEYEQKYLPDGKFHVDGYVCVFDVSEIQGRSLEKNIEYTALILLNLLKTKKPIVFATTKRDEATELFVREAERLVNRKEFRGYIPLVETSAHEHVNVDLPFVVCAQLIDRTKGKAKIWTFQDALHFRKETLEYATDAFQSLVRMQVTDYRSAWHTSVKKLTPTAEYINYCDLFGQEAAHIAFKRHIKKLKEDYIARKLQMYLRILPEVLSELVPDAECIGENSDWITVKNLLKHHPDYDQYFLENPPHVLWYEVDLNETNDTRIPVDLLETPEAENYYYEHKRALESEDKRKEMRVQFRQLLRDTLYVTPGKLMTEVRVLFMGRECYESLSEQDIIEMYGEHQKEITDSAKANFQELLQEHSDIFSNFAHMGPGNVVTQEDIFKITEVISGDVRYKALDRIEQDRTLMLLRHLGFLHAPIREHCPAFPNCIDSLIDRFVETRIKRRSGICNGGWCATSSLNILILGAGGLGEELAIALKKVNESFILDQTRYALDFRIIEGDVDLPQNAFNTSDFSPQACICVYSNHQTLEYVRDSFEKALLSNLEEEERLALHGLPIVLLFAADPVLRDQEVGYFREEGENQAKSLQCPFVDVTPTDPFRGDNGMSTDSQSLGSGLSNEDHLERWFSEDSLRIALQALIENVQRKTGIYSQLANQLQKYDDVPEKALNPDLRLLMCFLCGDPFDVSSVIGLFICDQNYHVTAVNAIVIEAMVGDSKKTIELIFTSYHGAQAYRDELLHGFVLVYSAHRKASLSTLVAFSNNIPNTPTQILAVAENSQSTGAVLYSNDLPHQLVAEGNAFSDKIRGHFMTTTQSGQSRNTFCASFYQDVWERKPSIERAFDMESSEYSSEREAGSAHGRYLVDEDGERIYEQLPSDNAVSPYMEKRTPLSPGDDSDMYTSVISQQQSDDGEQLLKPSQLRNRRSLMPGWSDNQIFKKNVRTNEDWLENDVYQSYQAEQQLYGSERAKLKPGKLNLKQFDNITDAVGRLNITQRQSGKSSSRSHISPDGYEQDFAKYGTNKQGHPAQKVRSMSRRKDNSLDKETESDSEERSSPECQDKAQLMGRPERRPGQPLRTRSRKKRSIPVAPPRLPFLEGASSSSTTSSSRFIAASQFSELEKDFQQKVLNTAPSSDKAKLKIDSSFSYIQSSLGDEFDVLPKESVARQLGVLLKSKSSSVVAESDKGKERKDKLDKKRQREEEKEEKRRLKEEERQKRLEEKKKKKSGKGSGQSGPCLEDFIQSEYNLTPLFVEMCIRFIEEEGLDSEGIYRVPGNRAHVDLLFHKFDEDATVSIRELDIPVNAVATALKDFFSKRLPPLIPANTMDDLTNIANIDEKRNRLLALRELLQKLPPVNFCILKFVFQHFVKISENSRLNSMDSKNLAICWWPTLLPFEFNDMMMFERMRPHLEESVQMMIDQYKLLYCDESEDVIV
ncbi:Rho GTPase-activating protein [Halotydeus destructor]|nr:Rho GTPase-activating protein [Halotydeus destructor]